MISFPDLGITFSCVKLLFLCRKVLIEVAENVKVGLWPQSSR